MKKLTDELINQFKNYLISEEKSQATIEKYIRDITALMVWLNYREITKQVVIEYKNMMMSNTLNHVAKQDITIRMVLPLSLKMKG